MALSDPSGQNVSLRDFDRHFTSYRDAYVGTFLFWKFLEFDVRLGSAAIVQRGRQPRHERSAVGGAGVTKSMSKLLLEDFPLGKF